MIDFTYHITDGFYRVYPETGDAIAAYNANPLMQRGLFLHEFEAFKRQARCAGYTVRKAKRIPESDDRLLADLGL